MYDEPNCCFGHNFRVKQQGVVWRGCVATLNRAVIVGFRVTFFNRCGSAEDLLHRALNVLKM